MPESPIPLPPAVSEGAEDEGPRIPKGLRHYRPGFRNRILTGLIFIVPLLITGMFARWLYIKCITLSQPWLQHILRQPQLPGWTVPFIQFAGVIVTLAAIVIILWLVGTLSSNFLTRRLLHHFERLVLGLPMVRWVYSFTKQVMELLGQDRSASFKRVVIVEFPHEGFYVFAFAAGETRFPHSDELYVSVFLPTTPNPTSGYMLLYPQSRVLQTDLSFEQAVRTIMSGGIIIPEQIGAVPYTPIAASAQRPPAKGAKPAAAEGGSPGLRHG
jgi:uncharacterized membrane protein